MRFDILQIYRKSIIKIFKFFKKRPQELAFLLPSLIESMITMANLAKMANQINQAKPANSPNVLRSGLEG